MFKFDFDIDDADEEQQDIQLTTKQDVEESPTLTTQESFAEIPLSQLLDALPSLISYSPLPVPLSSGRELTLARRDLFDARFQLISEGRGDEDNGDDGSDAMKGQKFNSTSALQFLDAPSDLVPGIYEGGLKTWECSLDLVDYLDSIQGQPLYGDIHGKRALEIGCGTGVPSLYLLHQIFSVSPSMDHKQTHIHLQDYNTSVLELVTFPNILLTWYMSPSSAAHRATESDTPSDIDPAPLPDPSSPAELPITPELKAAFISSLHDHNLTLRFFSGSWDTFDLGHVGGKYDLVLSSETIYRMESLASLTGLLMAACGFGKELLEGSTSPDLSVPLISSPTYLCLIAAKVLYFGVGGGVSEFIRVVEHPLLVGTSRDPEDLQESRSRVKGQVKTVWERNVGVGRKVMRVEWHQN